MELLQLRYFMALAENGNLTRTAELVNITPPTLSNSISRLEEELGVQLFDRIKGRLYLNTAGKSFLESSKTILNTLEYSCNNLRNMSLLGKKTLSVSTAINSSLLSNSLEQYLRLHPNIHLINKQTFVTNIESDLTLNHYSFVIAFDGTIKSKYIKSRLLSPENKVFYVLMSKKHKLAKKKSLTLEDLKNEKFIFPPTDLSLTNSYYSICRDAGFEPDVVAECSTNLLQSFVRNNLGISFMTSTGYIEEEDLVKIPVLDVTDFQQDRFSIYWAKNHTLTETENDFLEFMTRRANS